MRPTLRGASTALLTGYLAALLVKSARPYPWLPVRRYDMFATKIAADNPRSIVVLHLDDGAFVLVSPFHLFPFEAPRSTSILLEAVRSADPDDFAGVMRASLRLQNKGWLRFDQVWGPPPGVDPRSVTAACFHRVPRRSLGSLSKGEHQSCRHKVELKVAGR